MKKKLLFLFFIATTLAVFPLGVSDSLAQQVCTVGSVTATPTQVRLGQQIQLRVIGNGTCAGWGATLNVRCSISGQNVFTGSSQSFTAGQSQLQWNWTIPATNPCGTAAGLTVRGVIGTSERTTQFSITSSSTGGNPNGISQSADYSLPNILGVADVSGVINLIAQWIFNISIPIVVGLIIYAGLKFILARGESGKVSEAKKILQMALLGLAIILIGRGFVSLITSILSAN
jgi:hypothetical protein